MNSPSGPHPDGVSGFGAGMCEMLPGVRTIPDVSF